MRKQEFKHVIMDEERKYDPAEYEPDTIYVVRESFAFFLCPCGCGEITSVYFIPYGGNSGWTYEIKDGKITISPSVWFNKAIGCSSHYFIRENKIQWC